MKAVDTLSVWLIANTPIVRRGWALVIDKVPTLTLVGSCDYDDADLHLPYTDCDVVIVELGLCKERCWKLVQFLKEHAPDLPVLVTTSEEPIDQQQLQQAGVDKFVLLSGKESTHISDALTTFFEE